MRDMPWPDCDYCADFIDALLHVATASQICHTMTQAGDDLQQGSCSIFQLEPDCSLGLVYAPFTGHHDLALIYDINILV